MIDISKLRLAGCTPTRRSGIWRAAAVTVVVLVAMTSGPAIAQSVSSRRRAVSVRAAAFSPGSTAFRLATGSWNSTISYNLYNPDVVQFYNFSLLGLAVVSDHPRPGGNNYFPELATSWKLSKSAITIHLRRSAKWQNGRPFTSRDVSNSLLLAGANYNPIWGSISSVTTPTPHELIVRIQPWAVAQNVLRNLLLLPILPSSQYGTLIPRGFKRDLIGYWQRYNILHPTESSLQAATSSVDAKTMSRVQTALVKFNPSKLVGDGPYQLVRANVGGLLYKKWNGWWDAKAITVPWVEGLPMDSSTEFGALLSGRIDEEENSQYTDPQAARLNNSGVAHYAFLPAPGEQEGLVFHLADYPFNLLAVRRALAYLIDRPKLAKLDMSGKVMQNPATAYPDGLNHQDTERYLTPKQIASLHAYDYNPARAASLLRSAGFTTRNGSWYTPKGKLFAFNIFEPAGYTQFDVDGVIVAQMLKHFGIKAATQDITNTSYGVEQADGKFAVSEAFLDGGLGSPMVHFANTFVGTAKSGAWNYPVYYNGKGSCGCQVAIGIGPIAQVPGLGRVNIGAALNEEVNSAPPNTWPRYAFDWVRFINNELPFLSLYDNAYHMIWATARYTDFPSVTSNHAWMWTILAGAAGQVLWMQQGYLHLKH